MTTRFTIRIGLSDIPIMKGNLTRETGNEIAVYSPPLAENRAGIPAAAVLEQLGPKAEKLTLSGFLMDNMTGGYGYQYSGNNTAEEMLNRLISTVRQSEFTDLDYTSPGPTPIARAVPVTFTDDHGVQMEVLIAGFTYATDRKNKSQISVNLTMWKVRETNRLSRLPVTPEPIEPLISIATAAENQAQVDPRKFQPKMRAAVEEEIAAKAAAFSAHIPAALILLIEAAND